MRFTIVPTKAVFRLSSVAVIGILLLAFPSCSDDEEQVVTDEPIPDSLVAGPPVQILVNGNDPTVSRTGLWIAYEADEGIINKATILGDSITQLADSAYDPDWSLQNDLIVYRSGDTLVVIDPSDGGRIWTAVKEFDDNPAWSPDGNKIAVLADQGILVIEYPGGASNVVSCSYNGGGCDGGHPTWSPDGNWIAFEQGLRIVKVPADGGEAESVVNTGFDLGSPAWSPDGRCIAYSMPDILPFQSHIWAIDLVHGNIWQLTDGQYSDGDPAWAPDSRTVYFDRVEIDSTITGIWRVNIDFVFSSGQ